MRKSIYWYGVYHCMPYEPDVLISQVFATKEEAEQWLEHKLCREYPFGDDRHEPDEYGFTKFEEWLDCSVGEQEVQYHVIEGFTDHASEFFSDYETEDRSAWVRVANKFDLHVIRTDEGVVVDVWDKDRLVHSTPLVSTYAYDDELSSEQEDDISLNSLTKGAVNSPRSVSILWGQCPHPDDKPITYTFDTVDEREAFLQGIAECDGWMGYEITEVN